MGKKTLTVERYCLTREGDMEQHPHGGWYRVADAERAALAIKTAAEAPLLAEIERLKEENSVLAEHLGSSERYGRDVLGRAIKAEADLKAAQEKVGYLENQSIGLSMTIGSRDADIDTLRETLKAAQEEKNKLHDRVAFLEGGTTYVDLQMALGRLEAAQEREARLREALKDLLRYADRQTCSHDETHRGGAIWEICDCCGMKWGDDEGGKPEWQEPKEMTAARKALAPPAGEPVEEVEG